MRRSTALALAAGALAVAKISQQSLKAHIPGDVPEDHEDNTYGLPNGNPVRKQLRRYFRDQLKRLVGFVAKIGTEIPHTFPAMADYDDPIASAMTPIIGQYWDKVGKGLRGRLGLDTDEWRVADPNVHKAIKQQCLKFAASTNATTDLAVGRAREAVRQKLAAGLIAEAQTIPELTRAIREVFKTAIKSRAETIARTETARAVHAAAEMSIQQTGLTYTKKWLLSAHSCPVCVNLAAAMPQAGPGQAFGTIGKDADYAVIRFPPAHPNCRCSITFVVAGDGSQAGDVPAFVPSASPQSKAETA